MINLELTELEVDELLKVIKYRIEDLYELKNKTIETIGTTSSYYQYTIDKLDELRFKIKSQYK